MYASMVVVDGSASILIEVDVDVDVDVEERAESRTRSRIRGELTALHNWCMASGPPVRTSGGQTR